MDPTETALLAEFGRQRHGSFSEAAEHLVRALATTVPGTVALVRIEQGESEARLIEVAGEGGPEIERGARFRVTGDGLDPEALGALGAGEWISAPLVVSTGNLAGVLFAAGAGGSGYTPAHQGQLEVAARLLSLELEGVELRAKLRRLRGLVNAGPTMDPATGLPNRDSFLQLLEHEWRLAQRGTVRSTLVTCRVIDPSGGGGGPAARTSVGMKVAAEVLEASTRVTDRVGRVGDSSLAAVLIGCGPEDAPAFVARFLSALERVGGDAAGIEVSCGVQPLDAGSSPDEVLGLAEAAAARSSTSAASAVGPS